MVRAKNQDDLTVVDGQDPVQDDIQAIRENLQRLKLVYTQTYFEFGAVLQRAFELSAHKTWGFNTWQEYVEGELGMSERRVRYLLSIHRWFSKVLKDHPHVKQRIEHLGWSKVKLLVGIVDETNVDEWVERAESMSLVALEEFVKGLKDGKAPKEGAEHLAAVTFRLYPDQATNVEEAMELAGEIAESDKRGHLLDLICTTFKADHVFSASPGTKLSQIYLAKIEKILGVRLIVVNADSGTVMSGIDVLEKLASSGQN